MGVFNKDLLSAPAVREIARRAVRYATSLVLVLMISAGSAWSLDRVDTASSYEASDASQSPSPAMADSCLPLLNIRHTPPVSAMDRTQRSAGTAAALGVVFGVRFALGPKETAKTGRKDNARLSVWQPANSTGGDRHALAIADYRDCQREQALKALSDFRWSR